MNIKWWAINDYDGIFYDPVRQRDGQRQSLTLGKKEQSGSVSSAPPPQPIYLAHTEEAVE